MTVSTQSELVRLGGSPMPERAGRRFWIGSLMLWGVERVPAVMGFLRPFLTGVAWRTVPWLRQNLLMNAARLLGAHSSFGQRAALARSVLLNNYDFVCDLGRSRRLSDRQLLDRIDTVDGLDRYTSARALKRGALLVTAHLGSFETGVVALRQHEPRVHVVFRRDSLARFERLRAEQRRRFGVCEAALDDGFDIWVQLRDALHRNEVVLMQGDRVMPGQKGVRVPFMGGHMMMPAGPVKLALASGAPVIPIFAPRTAKDRFKIILEQPILVEVSPGASTEVHPALLQLAAVIERYVKAYPDQWLALHRAWCEDAEQDPSQ